MISPIEAADQLDELIIACKKAVPLILTSEDNRDFAYAVLYELRLRLGYIVRETGVGLPLGSLRKQAIIALGLEG